MREGEGEEGDEAVFLHELCCGMNPETVVAEGLAIRGAVLAGTDSALLREMLVLDCLHCTIGLLSWLPPAQGQRTDDRFPSLPCT